MPVLTASSKESPAGSSTASTTRPRSAAGHVPWHTQSEADVCRTLGVDRATGLAEAEVAARLARDGPNAVAPVHQRSAWQILLQQFKSMMIVLLLVATGVSFALGDIIEGYAIALVVALNAALGFATEWRAAVAIRQLRAHDEADAHVRRAAQQRQVAARTLVVGDVVILAAGDRVPADARIMDAADLAVDESSLTGESLPTEKSDALVDDPRASLGDRTSMVYAGTLLTGGRAVVIVTAIGAATEIGRIGTLINDAGERQSPLEIKLATLTRVIIWAVLAVCSLIIVVGWLSGRDLAMMIKVGVSLAIAAVPEGLLAVTTMTLALGMRRMATMKALVRRLPAVEALGSTTVICTDKTGTLTRNELTVRVLCVGAAQFEVTGTGYTPRGEFRLDHTPFALPAASVDDPLMLALRIGALCNDAVIVRTKGPVSVIGDPTEAALLVLAEKAGLDRATLQGEYVRIDELPFRADEKYMATLMRGPDGAVTAYVKGAPAVLLAASSEHFVDGHRVPLDDAARAAWMARNDALASRAMRVLTLAVKALPGVTTIAADQMTSGLTMIGMVGMIDPLAEDVDTSVATCRAAGIRIVMVTGDQLATAAEIARQLGIDRLPDGTALKAVHAHELGDLDDDGWKAAVAQTAVFARVSPDDKQQIVRALQRRGEVVAMTGDGVNDAPALRVADIGIAMGARGTDVAKDASDIIITDDRFATIVDAVEQGRVIVNNILRFIHYLFSCNVAELAVVVIAVALGWPLPLAALQILWLNLLTDVFPAVALAIEPTAVGVMSKRPRDPSTPLMTPAFGWLISWQGAVLSVCTLIAFRTGLHWYSEEPSGLAHAETMAFMTLAMAQLVHAFNVRSVTRSAFSSRTPSNPWLWWAVAGCAFAQLATVEIPALRTMLGTTSLTRADWLIVLANSIAPLGVVELVKLAQRRKRRV